MGWFADQRAVGPKSHHLKSLEQLTLDSRFLCNTGTHPKSMMLLLSPPMHQKLTYIQHSERMEWESKRARSLGSACSLRTTHA